MSGEIDSDYPKHPGEQQSLEELIKNAWREVEDVKLANALTEAMLRFKTRMRELGRDEDYLDDEFEVMKVIKGDV